MFVNAIQIHTAPIGSVFGLGTQLHPLLAQAQGTTKKLCLCNLQREKDAERAKKSHR